MAVFLKKVLPLFCAIKKSPEAFDIKRRMSSGHSVINQTQRKKSIN